jgi:predicted O-linked N-acetylglucosamine transferase (SPINDLY family)
MQYVIIIVNKNNLDIFYYEWAVIYQKNLNKTKTKDSDLEQKIEIKPYLPLKTKHLIINWINEQKNNNENNINNIDNIEKINEIYIDMDKKIKITKSYNDLLNELEILSK